LISLIALIVIYSHNNFLFILEINWLIKILISFSLDRWSLCFFFTILSISGVIYFYTIEYLSRIMFFLRFNFILTFFILSMVILIFSNNLIFIIISWDILGISSYFLIIFYHNNNCLNSGIITLMTNRLGDIGLIFIIIIIIYLKSWKLFSYNRFIKYYFYLLIVVFIISCCTKRASLPFSAWLPLAMAAPTPVSSLVHSSTLVTAGIYLIIRFFYLKFFKYLKIFFFLGFLTNFIAGITRIKETNIKKIVALSTLSQLGVIIVIFSSYFISICFFHLICHAFFKALLFIAIGIVIHWSMDNQFKIKIFLIYNNYWILIILYVTLINLCSLPFLAGFYSKDFFLLYFLSYNNFNRIYIIRIFFLIFFTIIYSFNIVNLIVIQKHSILFIKNKKRYVYSSSLINIFFYSLFIGFFISWNFFYFEEFCYLTPNWSIIIFTINASLVYFLINKKQNSFLKKKIIINFFLKYGS